MTSSTHVGRFNKPIHAARRALHWQKYKLLLLANRSTDEDHGGLERLSIELIQTIGNFLVHGEKDRHGREYVPLGHIPWQCAATETLLKRPAGHSTHDVLVLLT